ncbi:MAG: hypothetical protein RJA07_2138 [Bacteroidota bacterium]|jgi:hypothetical protein
MTIEQLNSSKVPVIVFDKKLEQFRDKVLFPEKVAQANKILSKVGLPNTKTLSSDKQK